jgi:hypothetical protein
MVAGAIGAYYVVKSYRSARASCPSIRKRVYGDSRELIRDFDLLWESPGDIASLRRNPMLDARFVTMIALAVAGAHGRTTPDRAYLRLAYDTGLTPEEAQDLIAGGLAHATTQEAAGLRFVRHLAERDGVPEPEELAAAVAHYGEGPTRDMVTAYRIASLVDRVINTWEALHCRLLGRPSPDTTLRQELSIVLVAIFGLSPLALILAIRAAMPSLVDTHPMCTLRSD